MKNLDLQKLLSEGKITKEEFAKFSTLSEESPHGSPLINIIIGFSVVAILAGILFLVQDFTLMFVLSIGLTAVWFYIRKYFFEKWEILANIFILLGSLSIAASYLWILEKNTTELNIYVTFSSISLFFAIMSYFAKSNLLAVASALAITPMIQVSAGNFFNSYFFHSGAPILAIVVYGALSALSFLTVSYFSDIFGKNLPPDAKKPLLTFSKTAFFLVHMSFWVASFWGDEAFITPLGSSILWALFIIASIVWGNHKKQLFFFNTSVVFGIIHFYTRLFIFMSNAAGLILGGILGIFFAIVLWKYNQRIKKEKSKEILTQTP